MGYVMQTELAIKSIPILMSIMSILKELFVRKCTFSCGKDKEKEKETETRLLDILSSLTTLNIEGTDPMYFRDFESSHPIPQGNYNAKETFSVPRAIGYVVVFDPASKKMPDGNFHMRTSRTTYEFHPSEIPQLKNLVFMGSSLSIRFSSNMPNASSWGFKLTVKPIIAKLQLIYNQNSIVDKDVVNILTTKNTSSGSSGQVTSWLNLLNQLTFVTTFLTRGLQDSNLIALQTNGCL